MAKINQNYLKLTAGYLFPEIARRVKAFVTENEGVKVYRLGVGNTTEPLTTTIIAGLHKGVDMQSKVDTYLGYGDEQGEEWMRKAVAQRYAKYGVVLSTDEIFISDGAKCDSGNIQEIFSSDAIIAVQDPAYPVYVDTNVMAGRTGNFNEKTGKYEGLVYMPCTPENNFFPKVPTKKVDLIYICSPNNPTGAVATKEQLKQFVDYAKKNKAIIIFDASYSAYVKDKNLPRTIYEIEGAKDCAIEIQSLSKEAGFTGVRLGWSIVPKTVFADSDVSDNDNKKSEPVSVNKLWNRRYTTKFNGASNVVQRGAEAALSKEGQKECQGLVDYYMENAKIIKDGLIKMGFTVFGGENAPYVWVKTPNKMKSWEFFDKVLREAHVVITPGSGFGPCGEGFVRFSSYGHRENIKTAMESIKKNLNL